MAKKPKKEAAEEATGAPAEGAPAAEGGGKSKKKLIMMAAAAVILLGGVGGGGYYWFVVRKHKQEAEAAAAPGQAGEEHAANKKTAYVELKEMMVNLSGQTAQQANERPRFLKMKIALEVSDPKVVAEVQPLLPRIEDTFQVFTRELRSSDLEGSAGVYRLKEELLRRVNVAIYPSKVDAVLFKEILIQ
jgi:flagellar protein FliL